MKKYILTSFLMAAFICCYPQSEKVKKLVDEGIVLHDKGDYANAIKKYDEAIAEDGAYIEAWYEKTFSLFAYKKLEECIDLSKKMIQQFPESPVLKGVYVQYGSSLDNLGRSSDAIKIYNEGLKKFPGYFLLNFNKAITYTIMNDLDKAYASYQDALINNPFHASSYFRVAQLLKSSKRIPAMLAGIMHLVLEPQSDRSAVTFASLKELIYANVKKTGDNTINITLDMPDSKKSKNEKDDFSMQELLFTMSSALDKDSVLNSVTKTDIEKFDLKFQLLINSLTENKKGFFSERYVPFFKRLKENEFTMIVSRLVFKNTNDEANAAWLKVNTHKTQEFYEWAKAYKWPDN